MSVDQRNCPLLGPKVPDLLTACWLLSLLVAGERIPGTAPQQNKKDKQSMCVSILTHK